MQKDKTCLGLLGFLAGFIWFMNSKWRWQEVFAALHDLLAVVGEGEYRRPRVQSIASKIT